MTSTWSMTMTFCCIITLLITSPVNAAAVFDENDELVLPPSLSEMEMLPRRNSLVSGDDDMAIDIRGDAMREAALSFGARGGLAWQTFYIRQEMDSRGSYMDKVFDFRHLLIGAPSGLLIEPPTISESQNALIIDNGGLSAAVADRVYDINVNARIVAASRDWRNYMERDWGAVTPPPDILRPATGEERKAWIEWVNEGWDQGVDQANLIFEADLAQLQTDYQGMVRYRILLAQGMVSQPFALQTDRGITGGGATMRVGDRAIELTGLPELIAEGQRWQPASR